MEKERKTRMFLSGSSFSPPSMSMLSHTYDDDGSDTDRRVTERFFFSFSFFFYSSFVVLVSASSKQVNAHTHRHEETAKDLFIIVIHPSYRTSCLSISIKPSRCPLERRDCSFRGLFLSLSRSKWLPSVRIDWRRWSTTTATTYDCDSIVQLASVVRRSIAQFAPVITPEHYYCYRHQIGKKTYVRFLKIKISI